MKLEDFKMTPGELFLGTVLSLSLIAMGFILGWIFSPIY